MRHLPALLLAITLALGLVGCQGESDSPDFPDDAPAAIPFEEEGELAFVQDGDTVVTVQIEIAETDSARTRGMMGRESFPNETSAMLFPFPQEQERSFWMSNTPLSLDLFFVNADSQIVSIAKYAKPYSSEQIRSQGPAKYVVETPAGFADTYGILAGDRVRWERSE